MRVCPRCGKQTDDTACPDDGATTVPIAAAASTYPAGTVIDERYRIDSVLGIGGFGAVYKATLLAMDQVVAIKVLKSEHIQSEEHIKRFAREARAASKLGHPNTIRISDFGSHSDHALYLAMEYLEGVTLADRLDTATQLSAKAVVHIISQICHSLTEAHEHGIIHRDLKPENIMLLSVPGVEDFVKVLDFGIAAKVAESGETDEKLTEMGMIMGTPSYMSPEQALGKQLDARSDIYALGVLMYEGLTGVVPFEGDQPMNVLVRHINDPPVEPRKRAPEANIPAAVEKVVLRCLEKDPRHRPQSTQELALELERALAAPDGGLRRGPAPAVDVDQEAGVATTAIPSLAGGGDLGRTAAVGAPVAVAAGGAFDARSGSRGSPIGLIIGAIALVAAVTAVVVALVPTAPGDVGNAADAGSANADAASTVVHAATGAAEAAQTAVESEAPDTSTAVVAPGTADTGSANAVSPRADTAEAPATRPQMPIAAPTVVDRQQPAAAHPAVVHAVDAGIKPPAGDGPRGAPKTHDAGSTTTTTPPPLGHTDNPATWPPRPAKQDDFVLPE
jgi:tRNA A-37 threonylcarbamoyl transferase component Bud32